MEDLEKDEGLDTLIAFFDRHLGKDDLADFPSSSLKSLKSVLEDLKAKEQRMLVLTGLDFNDKERLYEQAKTSLKKVSS